MAGEPKRADAVFEGGGVKGIALVGAVAATEARGYQFQNVAGTSAGAIVAALVAAGYGAAELGDVMKSVDYKRFLDKDGLDRIPIIGKALSLGFEKGIYEGRYFEGWLRELLAAKGKKVFGDLLVPGSENEPKYRYKLQVIAADLTRGKLLVLPRDARDYGIDPDQREIARAVRMSMSTPFFFEPIEITRDGQRHYIVDGGVLSNFPVWLFDDDTPEPAWPTFGYKLVEPNAGQPHQISGPVSLLAALFTTMMEAHDARYIEDQHFARTIPIPTLGVQTTDFDLPTERRDELYTSGVKAANAFFESWDFERYKAKYRAKKVGTRQSRIMPTS